MDRELLESVPHEERHFMMVGVYLNRWALVEANLNDTLARALRIDNVFARAIVTTNLHMQPKINTLKALIHMVAKGKDAERYLAVVNRVEKCAHADRNTHHLFGPDKDSDGVIFYVVKARGKLKLHDVDH
jgi:hypothetical protein